MRLASGAKRYNGVLYFELEVNNGSEVGKGEDVVLRREPRDQGVQGGDYRDVVTQGAGTTGDAEIPEEPKAA
jgi:hypothetical protein